MNAITISVGYSDILRLTLPRNLRHFDRFVVVTSPEDTETRRVVDEVWGGVRRGLSVVVTDAFYRNGGVFRKWLALEEGLDKMGRDGWLCVLDADVMLPDGISVILEEGYLCAPYRRMLRDPGQWQPEMDWEQLPPGPERTTNEWAGYCLFFHGNDPVLGEPPWWDTSWVHAGGADSWFYRKWAAEKRRRTPFEVLHLGEDGRNWCGRVTPMLDGTVPPEAAQREAMLREFFAGRRLHGYEKERR